MITTEKIDEWIHEAEERPSSAQQIIRFIGNRLNDLTKWNEELQAENLELRTGRKVEEFEERIATLEYQIGLLKRQLGGEVVLPSEYILVESSPGLNANSVNLLIYHLQGQVLRVETLISESFSGTKIGHFIGEVAPANLPLRLIAVHSNEEMLFAFDSGRTVTMPTTALPVLDYDRLDWQQAFLQPPFGTEELAFIQSIGRMALFEYCIQVSRKGCVKKIKEALFETYLGKSYIGTGIKSPPDKTCELVLCGKNDHLILVSKEGYLQCWEVDPLPTTIEEMLRLSITDHIISAFAIDPQASTESSFLFITQNGKVIQRHPDWLEISNSYKTKGQPIFSRERRESGIRLVGAALARDDDWAISLHSDGKLAFNKVGDLIGSGTLLSGESNVSILGFAIFRSWQKHES